jgi:hypothetical protein
MTEMWAAFLALHGLVHLAVWLSPAPAQTSDKPSPPFDPGDSWLRVGALKDTNDARLVARGMAVASTALYVAAAICLLIGSSAAPGMTAAAATYALALKLVFFNRWLTVGVAIDLAVLLTALVGWS